SGACPQPSGRRSDRYEKAGESFTPARTRRDRRPARRPSGRVTAGRGETENGRIAQPRPCASNPTPDLASGSFSAGCTNPVATLSFALSPYWAQCTGDSHFRWTRFWGADQGSSIVARGSFTSRIRSFRALLRVARVSRCSGASIRLVVSP